MSAPLPELLAPGTGPSVARASRARGRGRARNLRIWLPAGRLAELHAAGADTVYFHLYDVTDLDHVRLLGREVLPQVTSI